MMKETQTGSAFAADAPSLPRSRDRVPAEWNHSADKDSLKINHLEHVPIGKPVPTFPEHALRPNLAVLFIGSSAIATLSFIYLLWPLAIASIILGLLMIAGADVDARTFLLPNAVTYGAIAGGILAAPVLDTMDPWFSLGTAILRAAGTALLLALLREVYARLRRSEGLGLGDVKLAAAVGAWLPLETIPYCFALATAAALISVAVRWRGEAIQKSMKLPFGAYLCPALWLVFFITLLPS